MKIRKAKKSDFIEIKKIIEKCTEVMGKKWDEKTLKKLKRRYTLKGIKKLSKSSDLFVFEKNKKIIASGRLDKNLIATLYVNPKYQLKGIGTKIIRYLELLAKKRGKRKTKVNAIKTAIGFYKKMGYKIKNKKKGLMIKKLK